MLYYVGKFYHNKISVKSSYNKKVTIESCMLNHKKLLLVLLFLFSLNFITHTYALTEAETKVELQFVEAVEKGNVVVAARALSGRSGVVDVYTCRKGCDWPILTCQRNVKKMLSLLISYGFGEEYSLRKQVQQQGKDLLVCRMNNETLDTGFFEDVLFCAVGEMNSPLVSAILDYKIPVDGDDESSPLVNLFWKCRDESEGLPILRKLLESEADPNHRVYQERIPLFLCFPDSPDEIDYAEMMRVLLEFGADPNIQNEDGDSPLLYAVCYNYIGHAEILLEFGADLFLPNKNGETAFSIAKKKGYLPDGVGLASKFCKRPRTVKALVRIMKERLQFQHPKLI